MCRTEVYGNINADIISNPTTGWAPQQRRGRLLPIPEIGGDTGTWDDGVDRNDVAFIPPFENTKHRYPWICSLRYVISFKFNTLILILVIGQSLITLISVAPPS